MTMSERQRRDRTGEPLDDQRYPQTGSSTSGESRCAACLLSDPQARTQHHLGWLKERGLDSFRDHMTMQLVTLRDPGKKRQDAVDAIMLWASNLIDQYSGMADPTTGAKMPWWQARQWLMDNRDATAASAYTQAPDTYKTQNPPAGNLAPAVQHVTSHLRSEPGDDDPLAL